MGAALRSGEQAYNINWKEELGHGQQARVVKVTRKFDGLDCAAKVYKKLVKDMDKYDQMEFERELSIL